MRFVDTSILVSMLTGEDFALKAIAWMRKQPSGSLAVNPWTRTEFSAAIARQVRTGRLTKAQQASVMIEFELMIRESLQLLPIQEADFNLAASITGQARTGIRAGDALHIASAHRYSVSLVTFDKRLAEGAEALGYAVELIA